MQSEFLTEPLVEKLGEEGMHQSQDVWSPWPGIGGKRRPGKYQQPQRQEAKGLSAERGAESKGGRGINVKDSAIQPRSDRPQTSHIR